MKQKLYKLIKHHLLLSTVSTIVILGGLIGLYGYYQVLNQAFPKVLVHLDKGDGTFGETLEFDNTEKILNLELKPNQADAATRRVGIISVRTTEEAPLPLADIQKVLFDGPESVKAFYGEASYGKLILTPGQTMSLNSAITMDKSQCSNINNLLGTWTRAITTAAQNQGYNFSQNENTVIVFPFSCGSIKAVGPMPGSKLYIYGPTALTLGIVGHEFGHNLGMGHSAKVDCRAGKLPPDCTLTGGDNLSIMGGPTRNQPNNIHKAKAGWVTHQRVSTAGTYSLNPIEMDSQNSITVPASAGGGLYYLEYRKAIGFDANLANSPATKGVSIRTAATGMSQAIDTQLITILAKDQIYTDPNGRTKIKTCDAGGAFAKVGVTFDGTVPNCQGGTTPPGGGTGGTGGGETSCTETNPGLTINPSSQSSSPGGKLTYNVKVTNNSCTSASFTLSSNKPGNAWTSTFSQTSITNLAKGAFKEVTLNITSPANAPTSSYPINVTVSKNGSTQFKRTATITFQVAKVSVTSFKANGVSPTLTINKGSNVTLAWVCSASASARIKNADGTPLANNTNFNPSGSFQVGHAIQTNKTYTVECFEKASFKGNVATKSVSVIVR